MSRNSTYQFVNTDTAALVSQLIASYEQMTGVTVRPASPERLFITWVASVIVQERALNNYTGNQNIPSRATGADLDALGELFYSQVRPQAQPAITTMRFYISEPQPNAILVPFGTRVTDKEGTLVWETIADAFIPIGETYVDVIVQCQEPGVIGNGYTPGQIDVLVDVFPYYERCENLTESENGADAATDDEYYELMRASMDAFSTAGPEGAYAYYARQVSTRIADVVLTTPNPGQVNIYVLMDDGTIAGEEIKNAVYEACNDRYVRPLTDYVVVDDPEVVPYDIEFTYYISRNQTASAADIEAAVKAAVDRYIAWQSAKLGRDINPSQLIGMLMETGIKRVDLVSPAFTPIRDGEDESVPQVASVGNITIVNGGYEDD